MLTTFFSLSLLIVEIDIVNNTLYYDDQNESND